jgi:hypothetical protein
MTSLGKAVVFHLTYMAEMKQLYGNTVDGNLPDLSGLKNAKRVREMARAVGAAAYEQAADFVEQCGHGIEDHFAGLGIATVVKKRKWAGVLESWSSETGITVESVGDKVIWFGAWLTAPPEVRMPLPSGACGVVVPWLWVPGKAEDAVWKLVSAWAHSRGVNGLAQERGTVVLAAIPVMLRPEKKFEADRDPLVAEVVKVVERIGAKETRAIARVLAAL